MKKHNTHCVVIFCITDKKMVDLQKLGFFVLEEYMLNDDTELSLLFSSDSEDETEIISTVLSYRNESGRVKINCYFESVIPAYSCDDFQRHFRKRRG